MMHTPRRMRPDEAIYLDLEGPRSPMHVGILARLHHPVDLEPVREFFAHQSQHFPLLRRRPEPAFGGLLYPNLVWADDFDIERHVKEHRLAADEDVEELAAQLLEAPLPREHPLWRLYLLHQGDTTQVLFQVHRALLHEPSGAQLFCHLLHAPHPGTDESSDGVDHMHISLQETTGLEEFPREVLRSLTGSALSTFDWTRLLTEKNRMALATLRETAPGFGTPVRRLPFNRIGSGQRVTRRVTLSFAEARAIRQHLGGSTNDVGLTVLACAIADSHRDLLGEMTERTLRLLLPMAAGHNGPSTVSTTYLPVSLPLDGGSAVHRYRRIRAQTRMLRASRVPQAVSELLEVISAWPPPVVSRLNRWYRLLLPANSIFVQAAGPQFAVELAGSVVEEIHPFTPFLREMGIGFSSVSYNQRLCLGIQADRRAAGDLDDMVVAIEEAMAELKAEAGIGDIDPIHTAKAIPAARGASPASRRAAS